jgi:hypothetical protein
MLILDTNTFKLESEFEYYISLKENIIEKKNI